MEPYGKSKDLKLLYFKVIFVFLAIATQFAVMSAIVPIVPEMLNLSVHGMYFVQNATLGQLTIETTVDTVILFATPITISICLTPALAYITDVFGAEEPLFVGMVSLLIQTLIFAFSRDMYWYTFGDIFLGLSLCCLTVSGISSILGPFSDHGVRLQFIAILQILYSVKLFGPTYAGLLYEELGQTWTFLPTTLLVLVNIILYVFCVHQTEQNRPSIAKCDYVSIDEQAIESTDEHHQEQKHVIQSFIPIIQDVSMSSALSVYTCSSLTRSALMPIIALWLNDKFHSAWTPLIYVPAYVLQTVGILVAYNIDTNQFLWTSVCFVMIGIATISLPFSETLPMVGIWYAVAQLLVSMVRYWMFVLLSERGREKYRHVFGRVQALISLSEDISVFTTSVLSPILMEMFGFQNVCLFFGIWAFVSVSISIANHFIQSQIEDNTDTLPK